MPTMFLIVALGLSALSSSALAADPGWQDGRSTWFDVQDNDLKTANCHFRWDQVKTGSYVAAFSDSNPLFAKSCGMCIEVRCQNVVFKDGYGQTMDRNRACKDPSKSIYLTIADACPCNYPNNQHSNERWCCGDDSSRQHIDITQSAFAQLADTSVGVIGLQWRTVDCSIVKSGTGMSYGSSPSTSSPNSFTAGNVDQTADMTSDFSTPFASSSEDHTTFPSSFQPAAASWQPSGKWAGEMKQKVTDFVSRVFQS
ncbi:RlpA-like double-psi beta-barrel-protein domain-containing protein-containing protein [Haematococcus lacustris]